MNEREALSRIEGLLAQISRQLSRAPEPAAQVDEHRPNNPTTISGSVSINNQPTVHAEQSGSWTVGISGQPVEVSFSQPDYKYAVVNATSAGNTQVVAAVTGKKIRVVAYAVVSNDDVVVKFRSGTTDITGGMRLVQGGGIAHAFEGGLFQTTVGAALNINLSANAQVGGYVVYLEV